MTDAGSGFRQPLDVALVKPDAVAERHQRPEQAEAVDIVDRAAAAPPAGVLLLVGRLHEVHVQRHTVFARAIGEPR